MADKPAKSLRDTRKAPPYMRWHRQAGRSPVLSACIPLKTGKPCLRSLGTADPELARVKIVAVIQELIAAGLLDRHSQVAKLYLDHTISEDEIERGTPNSKTPPCMIWGDGTDLADGQLWQHRTKGVVSRVLQSQIYLTDGSMLRVCLNTADPKLAAKRLRPYVLKEIAEGKLRPDSKAARIYGGHIRRRSGPKTKWGEKNRAIPSTAKDVLDKFTAAINAGAKSNRAAIRQILPEIPPSFRTKRSGKELSIESLENRIYELQKKLSPTGAA